MRGYPIRAPGFREWCETNCLQFLIAQAEPLPAENADTTAKPDGAVQQIAKATAALGLEVRFRV